MVQVDEGALALHLWPPGDSEVPGVSLQPTTTAAAAAPGAAEVLESRHLTAGVAHEPVPLRQALGIAPDRCVPEASRVGQKGRAEQHSRSFYKPLPETVVKAVQHSSVDMDVATEGYKAGDVETKGKIAGESAAPCTGGSTVAQAAPNQLNRVQTRWVPIDGCTYQRDPPRLMEPAHQKKFQTFLDVPPAFLRHCYPSMTAPCSMSLEVQVPAGAAEAEARKLVEGAGGVVPERAEAAAGPGHGSDKDPFTGVVVTEIDTGHLRFQKRNVAGSWNSLEGANHCTLNSLGKQLHPFRGWRLVAYKKVR